MSMRDHYLDVQLFDAIASSPEPMTLDELSSRCVIRSGPSAFTMPRELARSSVRRLVAGGNVAEAGKRGARKLYRVELAGKPRLPSGYLYDRVSVFNGTPNVMIACPFNRITGRQLVVSYEHEPDPIVRVYVAGSRTIVEAFAQAATRRGFVYESKRDTFATADRSFGYVSTSFDRLEELAGFLASNDPH